MSCGSTPCSGYVIKATVENAQRLGVFQSPEYITWDKEYECDGIFKGEVGELLVEFLEELVSGEIRCPGDSVGLSGSFSVYPFLYSSVDGDIYDELEDGWYFSLYEESIYTKEYTPLGQALNKRYLFPVYSRWTDFS